MLINSKTLIISVSVGTGCFRHIKISDQTTLEELSDEILKAFDFTNDHLHAFYMDNRAWSDTDSYVMAYESDDDSRYTCDYNLQRAGLKPDKKFLYIFDFGDDWRFSCHVLKMLNEFTEEPQVVRIKGDSPIQYAEYDDWDED